MKVSVAMSVQLKVMLLLLGLSSTYAEEKTKTVWKVGYETIQDKCMPVGGLAEQDALPFPFASMDDCEKGLFADNFDNTTKRWDGIVLDNGECIEVWAHAKMNPFVNTNFSECEKERQRMRTTLAHISGSSEAKRAVTAKILLDPLKMGKFAVETSIRMVGLVFPPANLLLSVLNLFWPEKQRESVWDQVKDQVKLVINQKMNEAYAKQLKHFIDGLEGAIQTYNGFSDTHSHKSQRLVSIDTSLDIEEPKFMDKNDPISTLTYWITYVATRSTVKTELVRIASPSEKQIYVKQHLEMLKRYVTYTGNMAYKVLEKWRKSHLSCTSSTRYGTFDSDYFWVTYKFTDSLFGYSTTKRTTCSNYRSNDCGRRAKADGEAWCKSKEKQRMEKAMTLIGKLRENIKAWASLFNTLATNPLVKGFSAADSVFTTDGGYCSFPFTYNGQEYTKCTTAGRGQHWCNKKGGGWGYCLAIGKMDIDLTSCKMPTNSLEQYFGHKTVPKSGKTCKRWDSQSKYADWPMDYSNTTLVSNYCRRTRWSDDPWCYTVPSGWSYCSIPDCTSSDWEKSG